MRDRGLDRAQPAQDAVLDQCVKLDERDSEIASLVNREGLTAAKLENPAQINKNENERKERGGIAARRAQSLCDRLSPSWYNSG